MNYRMPSLFQDGHELEYRADFQVLESTIQLAEDAGVIPADVDHFVTL
jgi:hypothetical protein